MKKTLTTVMAAAAIALAGSLIATPAVAATQVDTGPTSGVADADARQARATQAVGGGIWSYGVDKTSVFSGYDNTTREHSTAVRSSGITKSSGWVKKGTVAWASRPKALSGNQSFWNVR